MATTFKDRLAAARTKRAKGMMIGAQLPNLLRQSQDRINVIMHSALGDKLPEDMFLAHRQWCTFITRIFIAELLTGGQVSEDEGKSALLWAHLTAIWCAPETPTVESMKNYRGILEAKIRSIHPTPSVAYEALNKLWVKVEDAAGSPPVTQAVVEEYYAGCPAGEDNKLPCGLLDFCSNWGHAIPWQQLYILTNDQTTIIDKFLTQDQFYEIPQDFHTQLVRKPDADFKNAWKDLETEGLLALLHCCAISDQRSVQSVLLASILGTLAAICKGDTLTDRWLTKHVDSLIKQVPVAVDIGQYIDIPSIQRFHSMYVTGLTSSKQIYDLLMPLYAVLDDDTAPAFRWIIEQARAAHTTHAIFLCDAILESEGRLIPYLMDKGLRGQLQHWASLVASILHNPWSSIREPLIPSAKYPDLSNLGFYVNKKIHDATTKGYAGKWVDGGILSKQRVEAIAEHVLEEMDNAISAGVDFTQGIDSALPAGYSAITYGDKVYIFNPNPQANPASMDQVADAIARLRLSEGTALDGDNQNRGSQNQLNPRGSDGNVQENHDASVRSHIPEGNPFRPAGEGLAQLREERDAALAAQRSTWGRHLRALPQNTQVMNVSEFANIIHSKFQRNSLYKAVNTMAIAGKEAAQQSRLHPYKFNHSTRLKHPSQPLPTDVKKALYVIMRSEKDWPGEQIVLDEDDVRLIPDFTKEERESTDLDNQLEVEAEEDLEDWGHAMTKAAVPRYRPPVSQGAPNTGAIPRHPPGRRPQPAQEQDDLAGAQGPAVEQLAAGVNDLANLLRLDEENQV